MHIHRFYIKEFKEGVEAEVELDKTEHMALVHQLLNVFRLKPAAPVLIFNQSAGEWLAEIKSIDKKSGVIIRLLQKQWTMETMSPPRDLCLYMSIIKNSNFDTVVEKAVEIGVSSIVPVITEHTVKTNLNFERLNKIIIEATEQCGRIDPFEISPIMHLAEAIKDAKKRGGEIFFADITGASEDHKTPGKKLALFIGPEGGWSAEEKELFRKEGVKALFLGHYVLRSETAAIIGMGKLMVDR